MDLGPCHGMSQRRQGFSQAPEQSLLHCGRPIQTPRALVRRLNPACMRKLLLILIAILKTGTPWTHAQGQPARA